MKFTAGIVYNEAKPNALRLSREIAKWLQANKCKTFIESSKSVKAKKADFVLSIGGDGTMINVIRTFAPLEIPVKGINMGSLGFLTDTDTNETYTFLDDILKNGIKTQKRILLTVEFEYRNKKIKTIAANECVVRSFTAGKMVSVDVSIDNQFTTEYKCDGMIISTPTGSTAYSLAALGPIVYPTLPVLIMTPISPHTLTQRPMILSDKSIVSFVARNKENSGRILLSADGQENYPLSNGCKVKFSIYKKQLQIITNSSKSYFETLKKKLYWGV